MEMTATSDSNDAVARAGDRFRAATKALDARRLRSGQAKRSDALRARHEEAEVIARILVRKYKLDPTQALTLALEANPLPSMLTKRGQPPRDYKLYETIERIEEQLEFMRALQSNGRMLTPRRPKPWRAITLQWNAINFREHPERQFLLPDDRPNAHTLRSAYLLTRGRLERRAAAIARSHARGLRTPVGRRTAVSRTSLARRRPGS